MCEILLSGFSAQMRADRRMRDNETGIIHVMLHGSDDVDDFYKSQTSETTDAKFIPQRGSMPGGDMAADRVIASPQRGIKPGGVIGGQTEMLDPFLGKVNRHERFVDDIIGQPLAPKKELDYFHRKGVWDMRRVQEAWLKTGRPPITVRWVEVSKGDDDNPNC